VLDGQGLKFPADKKTNEGLKLDPLHVLPASSVKGEELASAGKHGKLTVSICTILQHAGRVDEEFIIKMPSLLYMIALVLRSPISQSWATAYSQSASQACNSLSSSIQTVPSLTALCQELNTFLYRLSLDHLQVYLAFGVVVLTSACPLCLAL